MHVWDLIVTGGGIWGASTIYHAKKLGAEKVLCLEQGPLTTTRRASTGGSRVARTASWEGPLFAQLMTACLPEWESMSAKRGIAPVFYRTGGIFAGPPDGRIVTGAIESLKSVGAPHEVLTAKEVHRRFPAFCFPINYTAVYEPNAGTVKPESAVSLFFSMAKDLDVGRRRATLELHDNEGASSVSEFSRGLISVTTPKGQYITRKLVVSNGAWSGSLLPKVNNIIEPERGCVGWFLPKYFANSFEIGKMPVFYAGGDYDHVYGIPGFEGQYPKIGGSIHRNERGPVETLNRRVDRADIDRLTELWNRQFAPSKASLARSAACVWTNAKAPDDFIISQLPHHSDVVVATACGGEGVGRAPLVGNIIARMAMDLPANFNTSAFEINPERFPNYNFEPSDLSIAA